MDERGERVEDPDLHVAALEPDRVRQRVAVDRRPDDRRVDEPDVDVRQAGLPGDRALGLAQRLALDDVDQLLELRLGDRLVGALALLAVGRREALDELAGDADDDLARPEAGHLLGLLEGDRAVVDDGRDVGDRARLHVAQALPLAADAADRAVAVVADLEDERLRELRADVERGAGGERRRRSSRCRMRREEGHSARPGHGRCGSPPSPAGSPSARACPCPGPSPAGRRPGRRSPATPPGRGRRPTSPRPTRSSLTVTNSCGSSPSSPSAITPDPNDPADVLRDALQRVDRLERAGVRDAADRPGATSSARAASSPGFGTPPPPPHPAFSRRLRLAQLVLERPDPVRELVRRLGAGRLGRGRERVDATPAGTRPRPRRSAPRSGASRRRCSARR